MSDNIENKKTQIEMEEKNEESTITLLDVLELEEESAAVLGGSDEKECTYEKGYIKRQALYSCLTCCPEARTDKTKAAGVCLACSYQCHENHELVELYTKRNFRCDCPTERISQNKCTFVKHNLDECSSSSGSSSNIQNPNHKYPNNKENIYNQNFSGIYCICKRPYPDMDDKIDDEMIQCVLCEDWYHTRHLNASIPKADAYSEMTCGDCMEKFEFLKNYTGYAVNKIEPCENNECNINVACVEGEDDKLKSELDKSISDIMSISKNNTEGTSDLNSSHDICNNEDEPSAKKPKLNNENNICKRPVGKCFYNKGGVFWNYDWRENLCSCTECVEMYNMQKVEFLLDTEDTVRFYEENGLKKARETDDEKIIRALSSMDRVTQIEAITEYNKMKTKLMEFLRTFVINQKVVTEADIHEFFQTMKNEKNSNLGVPPHFCR